MSKKIIEDFIKDFRNIATWGRPYRNATVRFRKCSNLDFEERKQLVIEAGLNVFKFPSEKISGCDLLSDSGTTSMTMEQWSQLFLGDEAYGSNEGYFILKEQIVETFGEQWENKNKYTENFFIFHQGRAAEHALFKVLSEIIQAKKLKKEKESYFIIPSNGHFDTTEANIEDNDIRAKNLFCEEYLKKDTNAKFQGNMNTKELKKLLENPKIRKQIPLVYLTITNNRAGGQPVSMANIKEVRQITQKYEIPLFFDASRFAENAWFIQKNEPGYQEKSIIEIVHEMFSYVDGFHISFKKDGLVNMGGGILIKENSIFTEKYKDFQNKLTDHQILTEGHPTYGGLAGRDLKALAEGLKTVVREDYLTYRIEQVQRFGKKLIELLKDKEGKSPIKQPIGGHAVYIDIDEFFKDTKMKDEDFGGISLTALLLIAGHRLCELGLYTFGKFENGKEIPPSPRVNYVRAAIPRLVYEDQDLFSLAEIISILHKNKDKIPGVEVIYGRDLKLRHFKSRFKFKES